jgi:L-alanine-DL-glutamate epimerase-like enolase superfamily enzyme
VRKLQVLTERFPIAGKFTIARGSKTEAVVVMVVLSEGSSQGRGECVPYARYGESVETVIREIEKTRGDIEAGISRAQLQKLLPPGAARNAVDCAIWDLEAKISNVPAYRAAGLDGLHSVSTAYTISLGDVETMREATRKASHHTILKVKLGAPGGDFERIAAIREAAPNSKLIADANEGWTQSNVEEHLRACADAGFSLIEQPLPANEDDFLRTIEHPVPLCADESVHGLESLKRLKGLYEFVNIKLDKTGGLTEALSLARLAREEGLGIMVGCMVGTSLAMAPAALLAMDAEFVDLDGPLLLAKDREGGLRFDGNTLYPPERELWG